MNCLFHVPLKIDPNYMSGSHIRPRKMMQAFRDIGYEVDIIEGTAAERKEKIRSVEEKIKNGVRYEFMYAENSNMPTLLTEKHHLPTHPFLDFSFFKRMKKHGIPIGIYYRDIHWVYPAYKKNVPGIKGEFAILNFKYDMKKYNELIDVFYLQTMHMKKKFPMELKMEVKELPPGADAGIPFKIAPTKPFNIFYVGGVGGHYEMEELFSAVHDTEGITLTICTRESDWAQYGQKYEPYLSDRMKIVHKKNDELTPYFDEASVVIRYFISDNSSDYNDFCISIKVFEYLGHQKPIITIADTATGDWVEERDVGWAIPYDRKALADLLVRLRDNPDEVHEKQRNMIPLLEANTWQARAAQVEKDLAKYRTAK